MPSDGGIHGGSIQSSSRDLHTVPTGHKVLCKRFTAAVTTKSYLWARECRKTFVL